MLFGKFGKKRGEAPPPREPVSLDGVRIFFTDGQGNPGELAASLAQSWSMCLEDNRQVDIPGLQDELDAIREQEICAFVVDESNGSVGVTFDEPEIQDGMVEWDQIVWVALANQ